MSRTAWVWTVAFVGVLAVYVATCARTVTLNDGGELILAAVTLGVAHPPGFPVYTLVGFLFSKIPLGEPAFLLALMSAVFGTVAVVFFALIVRELGLVDAIPGTGTGRGKGKRREKGKKRKATTEFRKQETPSERATAWFDVLFPLCVALVFAFSITPWFYATIVDVYPLNLALLSAALWLVLRWRRLYTAGIDPDQERKILGLAGLLYGLALGVHHATVLLMLPGLAWLVLRTTDWRRLLRRQIWWAGGGVLVGLVAYAYLPIAAGRDPLFAWGDPSSLEGFWWHVSAGDYRRYLLSGQTELSQKMALVGRLFLHQSTILGVPLAVLGLYRWYRRDRPFLGFALLVIGGGLLYTSVYEIAEDRDAYLLTSFFVLVLAVGSGLRQLAEIVTRRAPRLAAVPLVLTVALVVANLLLHYRQNDRRRDFVAVHFVEDLLGGVDPGSLVLTRDWQFYSPFLYLHHFEGLRPDVTVVNVNLMALPWYVEGYLPRAYPVLVAQHESEVTRYLAALRRRRQGQTTDRSATPQLVALLDTFIDAFVDDRPSGTSAYIGIPPQPGIAQEYHWVPETLTFRLESADDSALRSEPELHLRAFIEDAPYLEQSARTKVRPTYAFMLATRGHYLAARGHFDRAMERIALAQRVDPDFDVPYQMAGNVEQMRGRLDAARAAYDKALELNPDNTLVRQALERLADDQASAPR